MLFVIPQTTILKVNSIFAKYLNIDEVILYGSRAKGNYTTGSDIDLTLKGEGINLEQLNKINNDIDDLLSPYTFDISIFNQISNPYFIEHIERVGRLFYIRRDGQP